MAASLVALGAVVAVVLAWKILTGIVRTVVLLAILLVAAVFVFGVFG